MGQRRAWRLRHTAEEAFAKACNNPEIFISENDVIAWATRHGVLEGANLTQVMQWMQNDGFVQGTTGSEDGPYLSVNWTSSSTLQSAISLGPVKIGIAADQIDTVWNQYGGRPGQVLHPGNSLQSTDGRYRFIYQTDGNLVLYQGNAPLWASGTNGKGVGGCIMQGDGNLVLYTRGGHVLWASGTNGSLNSHFIIQNDGNGVIYRPDNHAVWATNTNGR